MSGRTFRPPHPAITSGLLLALSFPPFPGSPLPFVALVPFALHVAAREANRNGELEAARSGLLLGLVHFAALLHWIPFALPGQPILGVSAWGAMVGLLALATALAGWLLHRSVHGLGVPIWVALPLVWTAAEWARSSLPGGLAFPWAGMALSLTDFPSALALARWSGERGVTLWIASVNGLLAYALLRRRERVRWLPGALAAACLTALPLVLLPSLPRSRDAQAPEPATLRVAVVQTVVSVQSRLDPVQGSHAMLAALGRLLPSVDSGSVTLIVLPETAFPLPLQQAAGRPYLEALQRHARRLGATFVMGALAEEGSPRATYNAVFVVNVDGVVARYDKRRLVPGFERTPLLPSAALAALGDSTSYAVGASRPLLEGGGVRLGALVCFESAFEGLALEQRRRGARLLVNVTNDGWFGSGLSGAAARAQHEAHLVLRAVGSGVPVVRSANGGASLLVEPSGRITRFAPVGEEAVGFATIRLPGPPPRFLWMAGLVGPLSAVLAVLLALGAAARPPRPAGIARGRPTVSPARTG